MSDAAATSRKGNRSDPPGVYGFDLTISGEHSSAVLVLADTEKANSGATDTPPEGQPGARTFLVRPVHAFVSLRDPLDAGCARSRLADDAQSVRIALCW